MSNVNDEVVAQHPLYARGLRPYGAYAVVDSAWLAELTRIQSSHRQFDESYWRSLTHYLFAFKDRLVEVLSDGFETGAGVIAERAVPVLACHLGAVPVAEVEPVAGRGEPLIAARALGAFTSSRYGHYGFSDTEYALVRRILGRDVAVYYSTTARKFQLDFAGVRF